MTIRIQVLSALEKGPLTIDGISVALPDIAKHQVREAISAARNMKLVEPENATKGPTPRIWRLTIYGRTYTARSRSGEIRIKTPKSPKCGTSGATPADGDRAETRKRYETDHENHLAYQRRCGIPAELISRELLDPVSPAVRS